MMDCDKFAVADVAGVLRIHFRSATLFYVSEVVITVFSVSFDSLYLFAVVARL